MGINVLFNDFSYEILPKQRETFDKYMQIIQWGRRNPTRFLEDFLNLSFTDHQKWILLSSWIPSNVVWLCSRSSGKALVLTEEVYCVPSDREDTRNIIKKTIGDLKVGDFIFGDDGKPTKVIHLNPIVFDNVYEVEFSDGEKIQCNADHLWIVNDRKYASTKHNDSEFVVRNTDFLYCNFSNYTNNDDNDYRFCVPLNKPLQYIKYRKTPIDPYLFGKELINNGECIPNEYLYTSVDDRLSLLQGLMDMCGTTDKDGNCEFVQSNEKLVEQVYDLILSLGMKATLSEDKVYFTASKELPVFKLQQKLDILPEHILRVSDRKSIISVRKINQKKAMRCITVDNKSGGFLTGNKYTVTHNSYMSSPFIMAKSLLFPGFKSYIMAPSGSQAMETFMKLENLSKNNIASVIGVSSVFLDECVRQNATADPFSHNKSGYHVELYNGSEVNTLNSVVKNIVGIRSNLNVYDEGGKIERDFY